MRTLALSIPAASIARSMKAHLRPTDSIRSTSARGQRDRERQAGEAGAGADIGDPLRVAEVGELEAGEAVGDVDLPALVGLDDRADRCPLLGEELENRAQRGPFRFAERRGRVVAHSSETSGATTTQRWGSSPSL